jgi:hydrogenase maturation protease
MTPRILIACVGNIFRGDDGFGSEVALRLGGRSLPPEVVLKDFGIRGFDLAYSFLERHSLVILVDACAHGGEPGEVQLLEPDSIEDSGPLETHGMNPMNVLRLVNSLGGTSNRILIVGCKPLDLGSEEDGKLGLTEPVEAAVSEAVLMIENLVMKALNGHLPELALESH